VGVVANATPDFNRAAATFVQRCASCHGVNGNGQGELVLSGQVGAMVSFLDAEAMRDKTVTAYYDVITNGRIEKLMPPWRDALSESERYDLAQYVLALHRDSALLPYTGESVRFFGRVTNGTSGAELPTDLQLALRYGNLEDGLTDVPATLNADGTYSVSDVPRRENYAYALIAQFSGRTFASDVREGASLRENNDLPITLYALTDDPSVIELREIRTLVEPFFLDDQALQDGLLFTQTFTYFNTSDRVFSLAQNSLTVSLLVQLPPGAIVVNVTRNPRFIVVQEQFAVIDTQPVKPGEHLIELVYFVPYDNGAVIEQAFGVRFNGTASVTTTPKTLTIADSDGWQADLTPPQVNVYRRTYENASARDTLRYTLTGALVADTSANAVTADNLPLVVVLVVSVVIAMVAVMAFTRRAQEARNVDALLAQLAQLDALHNEGRINHDAYQQQRQALKLRIATLMNDRPKGDGGG
jgi:cytochrome c553